MATKKRSAKQVSGQGYADIDKLGLKALRRRPVQARGMRRVTEILDAFELLHSEHRFEHITMEDIAGSAGIQIGSLYFFFPDKTSVAVTALERALFDEGTVFRLSPDDEALGFEDYLSVLEKRMTNVWRKHSRLLELYFAFRNHPLVWELTMHQRQRTAKHISAKLRQLQPGLSVQRASVLGRQVSMVMGVLIDNLAFMTPAEKREVRRETRKMLASYTAITS